jgi:hypothetical protein
MRSRAGLEPPRLDPATALEPSAFVYLLLYLASHLGALLVRGMHKGNLPAEYGKDRIFDVPLSICSACREKLTSSIAIKSALRLVPIYRELLSAYPKAQVRVE